MSEKIIIVGAFVEILELAEEIGSQIIGCFDNVQSGDFKGYPILGNDKDAIANSTKYNVIPLIITPDHPTVREKLFHQYNQHGFSFTSLISEIAKISISATIGLGTIVQSFVNISSECTIGQFVKLNTACNLMHSCTVGDFVTIAPNAVILGYVSIGQGCYIGANATVLPNISITDYVTIGAGSVVTKSIPEPGTYVGIPAKKII